MHVTDEANIASVPWVTKVTAKAKAARLLRRGEREGRGEASADAAGGPFWPITLA